MANNKNISNNGEESQDRNISNQKKICFIITPIGENNSEIRRHIDGIIDQSITPAIGDKYKIVVAHREYEIGSINDRIIRSVYEADLVIANLTTTNPNVMFELAIRYSHGKPAIVIAEQGTKLPFDVIDENTIFYINDPAGASDLKSKISEYEKRINLEKMNYGPVYKVINKIPLYNAVESGNEVSNEKMFQYIIDRLDVMEKNVSAVTQDKTNKPRNAFEEYELIFKSDSLEQLNKDELINILITYNTSYSGHEMSDEWIFYVNVRYLYAMDMLEDIKEWVAANAIDLTINKK